VLAYAKNYFAVHFSIDYVNTDGEISSYYPDFFVKTSPKEIFIVETKGLEDLDVPLKMARLKEWCQDINGSQKKTRFDFVFVEDEEFEKFKPNTFAELVSNFKKYK